MKQFNRGCLYIPSIDAKDLYLAGHLCDPEKRKTGYQLKTRNGEINFSKYINSFDFSLDLLKLREIAESSLPKRTPFSFLERGKEYSNRIINVTFKYSANSFNKLKKNTYIQLGYCLDDAEFHDGIARSDGQVIGVLTQTPVFQPAPDLPPAFQTGTDEQGRAVYVPKQTKPVKTVRQLRQELYRDGFYCEGVHYIRFKRSSGSARVGKCLFIDERLYGPVHEWEMCGVKLREGDPVDLAALEAYIALPTSSIIGLITIRPEEILVIPAYESQFEEPVIVTELGADGWLKTEERNAMVTNSIFDGQSLIDCSILGDYAHYGMLLLRNRFFKSCCFNTNLTRFFEEHGITSISQLHKDAVTLASSIQQIKLVTTPNSIKYLKFGSIAQWLEQLEETFGVVKHEKKTHFFDGRLVQAHYQLLNTVRLSREEAACLLKPSLDYISKLNTMPEVLRYHTGCLVSDETEDTPEAFHIETKNEIIYRMMSLSEDFTKTRMYYDFKKEACKAYLKNMKKGHILIDGNYSVLFGNPYEMLLHACGRFDGTSSLPPGHIHTARYAYGKTLLGCRSPHISTSNLLLAENMSHPAIDRYFNLTDEIVCINSVGENILERLSGADFDSDAMIVTDNEILIRAARKYYDLFKVPVNQVKAQKVARRYTAGDKADLDFKTSDNKIGEIVNLSQELNTIMWSIVNAPENCGKTKEEIYPLIRNVYYDICQLNIMSCIEIDKAKKEFDVSIPLELKRIKERHLKRDSRDRVIKPGFLGFIARTKGYYNPDKKCYRYQDTSMDYILQEILRSKAAKSKASDFLPFSSCFEFPGFQKDLVNKKQVKKITGLCYETVGRISAIWLSEFYSGEEKAALAEQEKELLYYEIGRLKINPHTLYRLITYTDRQEYAKISKLLFYVIFHCTGTAPGILMSRLKRPGTYLVKDDSGDLDLYGIRHSVKQLDADHRREA